MIKTVRDREASEGRNSKQRETGATEKETERKRRQSQRQR